jgi:hypothetical protein
MWSSEEIAAFWGWANQTQAREVVPVDERCWRCDVSRVHSGCAADLCERCCTELKTSAAA